MPMQMTPPRRRWVRATLALFVACVPTGPVLRAQSAVARCPFEIAGIWQPTMTSEANPTFLSFSTDGWVSVLESTADRSPLDFDVSAQAKYRLVRESTATRIVFAARRGNDLLPSGTSAWDVADYGDASFVAVNESGERSYWMRVQTHRYYLTLAARRGDARPGPALVMWTSMAGRRITREALGVHAGRDDAAAFGPIPSALADEFASERSSDDRVMLRVELSETEFWRTHAVLTDWQMRTQRRSLPPAEPFRLLTAFVGEALGSLNRCGARIQVPDLPDVPSVLTFMQRLRNSNDTWHVGDDRLPVVERSPPEM
jgi:hypothetical protein